MPDTPTKPHGGRREGSGRKPRPTKQIRVSVAAHGRLEAIKAKTRETHSQIVDRALSALETTGESE